MPELPEVEAVRRHLAERVARRRVLQVEVRRREVVVAPGDPAGGFSRARPDAQRRPAPLTKSMLLEGDSIAELLRHGKQLALLGGSGRVVSVHLGMSGRLLIIASRDAEPPHTHLVWRLDDGSHLLFVDPRRFGGVWTFASPEELHACRWNALGPDALTVTTVALRRALSGTQRPLKAALLDQALLAGLGNIYADESSFRAGIDPHTPAGTLTADDHRRLARAIRGVLTRAIQAGGTTLRDWSGPDGLAGGYRRQHLVYARAGLPCRRCGHTLAGDRLAQRTTTWCPICQPTRDRDN
jgi:formamidopyrimidine-DNA glycosylase